MSRYIDADELKKSIPMYHGEYPIMMRAVRLAIDAAPTADVVEVVRCKDCKYFTEEMIADDLEYICNFFGGMITISPDYYCSYGERREE